MAELGYNPRPMAQSIAVEIISEMIHCTGCRISGVKTPYCESMCPIRQCAQGRGVSPSESMRGGKMVGYVMAIYDCDVPEYDIWHMMIDETAQGRGYGSAALDRVIEYIRTKPFGPSDRVALTCNKNNPAARKLYEKKGFLATGVEDEDEIELVLTIAQVE